MRLTEEAVPSECVSETKVPGVSVAITGYQPQRWFCNQADNFATCADVSCCAVPSGIPCCQRVTLADVTGGCVS